MRINYISFVQWWQSIQESKTNWKWLGRILNIAAVIYIGALIIYLQVWTLDVDWGSLFPDVVLVLFIYLVSVMIQYFVWTRILIPFRHTTLKDVEIYARTMLMRRLPGLPWHWIGGTALYTALTDISSRNVLFAYVGEWLLLVLTGMTLLATLQTTTNQFVRLLIFIPIFILTLAFSFILQPNTRQFPRKAMEGLLWIALYSMAWVLGGLILFILVDELATESLALYDVIQIWIIAGGVGMLTAILPSSFGVREISLTFLLRPQLGMSLALLIALLIRVIFILADIVWGATGWGLSWFIQKKRKDRAT